MITIIIIIKSRAGDRPPKLPGADRRVRACVAEEKGTGGGGGGDHYFSPGQLEAKGAAHHLPDMGRVAGAAHAIFILLASCIDQL